VALGEDIGHADDLEHRPHRPAGDDAGALERRLHEHARRAVPPYDGVVQRAALQPHLDHLAPRLLHRLLHRDRDFLGLALAHADAAVAVAHDGERGETENPAALDHLGDAVDRDHLLAQPVAAVILLLPVLLPSRRLRHVRPRVSRART
jgi:hypothetical protein